MGIGADLLGIADIRHASKHRRIAQIVHIRLVVLQLSNVYVLASMESSFGIALTQQHACCKWKSVWASSLWHAILTRCCVCVCVCAQYLVPCGRVEPINRFGSKIKNIKKTENEHQFERVWHVTSYHHIAIPNFESGQSSVAQQCVAHNFTITSMGDDYVGDMWKAYGRPRTTKKLIDLRVREARLNCESTSSSSSRPAVGNKQLGYNSSWIYIINSPYRESLFRKFQWTRQFNWVFSTSFIFHKQRIK